MRDVAALVLSSVQGLPSVQSGAVPPAQLPPLQVSLVVQALPSSQVAVLLVWTHPVAGLQLSLVQGLPSLQSGAGPPTQRPPPVGSLVVQALPSSPAAASVLSAQAVVELPLAVVG